MSYKIKKLMYKNLKYVKDENPVTLDFDENLILLEGPNGYGKSTVFDTIELLISGKIKHLKKEIANRGEINEKEVLANNSQKDIQIEALLRDERQREILVKRIFESCNSFCDKIYIDGQEIKQEELDEILNINGDILNVAVYISQLESLDFLQQKYKERKSIVASLIDNSDIIQEISDLEEFQKKVTERLTNDTGKLELDIGNKNKQISELEQMVHDINKVAKEVKYERLFSNEEYEFDKQQINGAIKYETIIAPLNDIKEFVLNYNNYINSKKINQIGNILNFDKNVLKALYYSEEINKLKVNLPLFSNIIKAQELMVNRNIENIQEINALVKLDNDKKKYIAEVIRIKTDLGKTVNENEKYILDLCDKRKKLLDEYNISIEKEVWKSGYCPLCGTKIENMQKVYDEVQKQISESNLAILQAIKQYDKEIDEYYKEIEEELNKAISLNKEEFDKYIILKELIKVTINNVAEEQLLLKEMKFQCKQVDKGEVFEQDYLKLKLDLGVLKQKLGTTLDAAKIDRFNSIKEKYYSNINIHDIKQIDNKISYIANYYNSQCQTKLNELCNQNKKMIQNLDTMEEKNVKIEQCIKSYIAKYKEAFKSYQTKIVEKVKIPLYIYSGKIIQNYPMGLGVITEINDNQIVFKTERKEDDIFNYLSAGQLNGVMLAIMLAVRDILDFSNSLNLIMIDDPLQTIDDVSAFSYADLLAEQFGSAQIILSTHEGDKADLLEFKFKQHERQVYRFNMHDKYIERIE